jgi:hypothetical protein
MGLLPRKAVNKNTGGKTTTTNQIEPAHFCALEVDISRQSW